MNPYYYTLILILLCPTNEAKYSRASQFLVQQNAARTALQLNPFVWNKTIARFARSYANQRRQDCALTHSINGSYGENIFWGSGKKWTPDQAVADWLAEVEYYDHSSNSCAYGKVCGHYTQIVWKDTKRIGCAKVVCNDNLGVFMTCNYDPPGNYDGQRPY